MEDIVVKDSDVLEQIGSFVDSLDRPLMTAPSNLLVAICCRVRMRMKELVPGLDCCAELLVKFHQLTAEICGERRLCVRDGVAERSGNLVRRLAARYASEAIGAELYDGPDDTPLEICIVVERLPECLEVDRIGGDPGGVCHR